MRLVVLLVGIAIVAMMYHIHQEDVKERQMARCRSAGVGWSTLCEELSE